MSVNTSPKPAPSRSWLSQVPGWVKPLGDRAKLWLVFGCAAALLLTSMLIAADSERQYSERVVRNAEVEARILADTSAAALAFGDASALSEYVSAFRADPQVSAAAIYDASGRKLAAFGQTPVTVMPRDARAARAAGQGFSVVAEVSQSGVPLGSVWLAVRGEPALIRLYRYSGAGLLVIMAVIMFLALGVFVRALSNANAALTRQIAELEKAEAALRQSQKMEAIGRLTGGIAHDFNNMLAIIAGSLDLLQRRIGTSEPRLVRLVDSASEGARRAAELTQRLLAFSRRQPLNPRPVDVGEAVRSMSSLLGRALGETIAVETVCAAGLWPAIVDLPQLEAALLNLCVNARDALPGGGKLTIECANAFLDRDYCARHDELQPGQYVLVAVTDTGVGITPDVMAQVFEPFFTTKPTGVGTGLGLSQVHGFVRQSGGHVMIYSEVGVGTTVKLYLPRSDAPAVQKEVETRRHSSPRRGQAILVVEDEAGVRDFAVQALQDLGFEVFPAASGDEGLAVLEAHPDIALVLSDVIMPGMNGRQFVEQAMKLRPDLKVVYMTGYTQNAIVHNGMVDPGTRLVTKPFSVSRLEEELNAALAETAPAPA